MVKPSLRTKSVGTKVTDEEYAELERAAQTGGKTLGEWCRETLLARVNGQEPKAATDCVGTGQVALMAELSALRAILLNVLFRQSNGERLTAEEMQRLIDRADSDKLRKARDRLLEAQESEGQRKEKS
jgi:hypothetical protein